MDIFKFKFLAPLIYFECESPPIILKENHIMIRQISQAEKKDIQETQQKLYFKSPAKYLLECALFKKKPETAPREHQTEAIDKINRIITILRLYKEGPVGQNLIIQPYSEESHPAFNAVSVGYYEPRPIYNKENQLQKYKIISGETKEFTKFYAEFDLMDFRDLDLAIEYFNKSYTEAFFPRDALINLMISLENLYLKGESLELSYKLSMRASFILATGPNERKEVFDDMKKAYKYRSAIVHGERSRKISEEFFFKIREYTRQSLIFFLSNPSLRNNLDKTILQG
ncbi:MAG: HEPN domain-containing protein [Deltaproteobacteria bacterium]|nr:HEPN domain-containing protein [Deltaproteobacteria bacterium]